jgi:hypothetical protein
MADWAIDDPIRHPELVSGSMTRCSTRGLRVEAQAMDAETSSA